MHLILYFEPIRTIFFKTIRYTISTKHIIPNITIVFNCLPCAYQLRCSAVSSTIFIVLVITTRHEIQSCYNCC